MKSSFPPERLKQVGQAIRKIIPQAALDVLLEDIATILHRHMHLPVTGDDSVAKLLCGGDVLRETKAQWLDGYATGLPAVRSELDDALDTFAEKLGVSFDHETLLREFALAVDADPVSSPTMKTFVNLLPCDVRKALED